MNSELIGLLIGFILTLFIYSYLIKDNPLYRTAIHILVGVSAAYAAVVVMKEVILPVFDMMRDNPTDAELLLSMIPMLLALLLLLKRLPAVAWVGNSTVALLTGIGAAVAITGAISGTLWPQLSRSAGATPVEGMVIAVLTVCALFTFQFTGKLNEQGDWVRPVWQRSVVFVGRLVLTITFAVLFSTIFSTSLTLLADRIGYFVDQFAGLIS